MDKEGHSIPRWLHTPPLRWLTLTLTRDDPGKFDPQEWIELAKRFRCDAVSWSAGGYLAFYPTRLPFHPVCPRLKEVGGDPFGVLVAGCRQEGMVVTARVDHHVVTEEVARAKPEWLARDPWGNPRRHPVVPELYLTCAMGKYNEEFMTQVLCEIMELYHVDGTNHNRWGGLGMCYCQYCRESFYRFCGEELPIDPDKKDEGWQHFKILETHPVAPFYNQWRSQRLLELWDIWNEAIRKINPDSCVMPGVAGEFHRLDKSQVSQRAYALYIDRQGRSGDTPVWLSGKLGKELRSYLGNKPTGLTVSVGVESRQRWKDSTQSESELRMWIASGVANGLHPKVAKFSGVMYDRRWIEPIEKIYTRLARWEPYLRNQESLARVAVFHSPRSRLYGSQRHDHGELGIYQAMLEARIPTDAVFEDTLTLDALLRYQCVILPNVERLSNQQCQTLIDYVQRGGGIIATLETSLYDHSGQRRSTFGLSPLFQVKVTGKIQGPLKNTYVTFNERSPFNWKEYFGNTSRIIGGEYYLPVESEFPVEEVPFHWIPSYPDLPMEDVYPRFPFPPIPAIYFRQYGLGRVVYIPWDLDMIFWRIQHQDHAILWRRLVEWVAHDPYPVKVEGNGFLEVTCWKGNQWITVHLVNLCNPMTMRGFFREILPAPPQHVTLILPEETKIKSVRLLDAQTDVDFIIDQGQLQVEIPSIQDHEILLVEFLK